MDLSKPSTHANLEAAFGGESMANRKYLFFANVAKQLGHNDLAKLFRDTAAQETEHAFAHFRLLHPELVVNDPASLSEADKQALLGRCLELAIEGETYEFTTMYPEFAAQARSERDGGAEAEFNEQIDESKQHAGIFRTAAKNFGLLTPIEKHHAETYSVALEALQGKGTAGSAEEPSPGKWICKLCSMIYDPPKATPIPALPPAPPLSRSPTTGAAPSAAPARPALCPTGKRS